MTILTLNAPEIARLLDLPECEMDGDECRLWLVDGGCIVFRAYMAMLDVKHYDAEAAALELM